MELNVVTHTHSLRPPPPSRLFPNRPLRVVAVVVMEICEAPILRIIIIIIIMVVVVVVVVVVVMDICKAPTLRLKAPNKHNITHVMYMEMEHATSN